MVVYHRSHMAGAYSNLPCKFPYCDVLSLQIGHWHVSEGLSMDNRIFSSNISDSLFNTTLIVTTILVSEGVTYSSH